MCLLVIVADGQVSPPIACVFKCAYTTCTNRRPDRWTAHSNYAPRPNPTKASVILTGGARFAGAEGSLCYGVELWKGTGDAPQNTCARFVVQEEENG